MAGTARADTRHHVQRRLAFTGTIVSSDGKQVALKLDYAGGTHQRCRWAAARQATSSEPIYVVTAQGVTISGMVTTDAGDLVVTRPRRARAHPLG